MLVYRKLILKGMNYFINDIGKYVLETDSLMFHRVNPRRIRRGNINNESALKKLEGILGNVYLISDGERPSNT